MFVDEKKLSVVNWKDWQPDDIATLVFVMDKDQVLLIRKKRGLGAGKINAPGGKCEKGESIQACAIRELQEEVGLIAHEVKWCGENLFQFVDGYGMHVHVYIATKWSGTPIETEEAIPFWFHKDKFPFDQMWEDDYLWVPLMMAARPFSAQYLFDGESMLDYKIALIEQDEYSADRRNNKK